MNGADGDRRPIEAGNHQRDSVVLSHAVTYGSKLTFSTNPTLYLSYFFLDILSSYLGIMPLVDSLLLSQNLVHSMKHFAKNKVEVKRNHARTSGGCP